MGKPRSLRSYVNVIELTKLDSFTPGQYDWLIEHDLSLFDVFQLYEHGVGNWRLPHATLAMWIGLTYSEKLREQIETLVANAPRRTPTDTGLRKRVADIFGHERFAKKPSTLAWYRKWRKEHAYQC